MCYVGGPSEVSQVCDLHMEKVKGITSIINTLLLLI
jgi:hypothetical protein